MSRGLPANRLPLLRIYPSYIQAGLGLGIILIANEDHVLAALRNGLLRHLGRRLTGRIELGGIPTARVVELKVAHWFPSPFS